MDPPLVCSTYDHQPQSTDRLPRLGAIPNLAAKGSGLTALHFTVIDNQHNIIQQPLSYDADCTLKAKKLQSILHQAAMYGDNMIMNTLSQARLMGVDAEARNSLGKTPREYFEERCGESVPDAVKDAFSMLLDTTTVRTESQYDDGPSHEVFYYQFTESEVP